MQLRNLLAGANVVFLCYGTITLRGNLVTAETMDPGVMFVPALGFPAFGSQPIFPSGSRLPVHRTQFRRGAILVPRGCDSYLAVIFQVKMLTEL
jgi:hypothetical protein